MCPSARYLLGFQLQQRLVCLGAAQLRIKIVQTSKTSLIKSRNAHQSRTTNTI